MREVKERPKVNVELASPDQFMPVPMEPELYRFSAIDPPSFRRAVDAVFAP